MNLSRSPCRLWNFPGGWRDARLRHQGFFPLGGDELVDGVADDPPEGGGVTTVVDEDGGGVEGRAPGTITVVDEDEGGAEDGAPGVITVVDEDAGGLVFDEDGGLTVVSSFFSHPATPNASNAESTSVYFISSLL